jgi:hypothetical protein
MCKKTCDKVASHRFTWPGNDEAFICENHQRQLKRVADTMGLHLQTISLGTGIQKTCTQKVNEK